MFKLDSFFDFYKRHVSFVFILFLSLYSIRFGIPLSDYAVIAFILVSFFKYKRLYFDYVLALYWVWFALSIISVIFIKEQQFFNTESFILSSFRNCLLILAISFLPLWLKRWSDRIDVAYGIKWFLLFCPIIQLVFFIMFNMGYHDLFNIVAHGEQSNRHEWLNIYDYTLYMRFGGLFEEPSWYGWFNVYLFGILVAFERYSKVKYLNFWELILVGIGFMLTFSIAGILSFLILCFLSVSSKKIRLLIGIVFFILIMGVFIAFYDNPLIVRILTIIDGSDGSANARIFGSYFKAVNVISNLPMGAGVGNTIEAIKEYFYHGKSSLGTVSNQNGFIEIYLSTGLLLGSLYLLPIILMVFIDKYRLVFITISLVYFTTSSIYISPMWIFLALSIYILKGTRFSDNHDYCIR
ncbi:hypothetical protein [Shewanella sp. NKUCC06_TVS]|uniref:hypothetical protein n=1 Tax=Shewanella sp. NKUCC06_TVS TaxID=2842128 RepID=UPI001C5B77B4|nr:hypothetical protein [Shewanella sp. NKUCC06_TVS]MBW3530945.1 hypothetical protein [Shewanella sp. NKUCC06_TVS]